MKILLTNDDGHYSEGLHALRDLILDDVLSQKADVFVVAPETQQSGISQAITFLRPITVKPLFDHADREKQIGFMANGTPTDCVKLGLNELCPWKPDLVISGINWGLNVGINVCHSGTVGGAMAAAMFGTPAFALSLEGTKDPDFRAAAKIMLPIVDRLRLVDFPAGTVININVPTSATTLLNEGQEPEVQIVPVELNPLGYHFQTGKDPKDQDFFWATNNPAPKKSAFATDAHTIAEGIVTVTAITYDLNSPTAQSQLQEALAKPQNELA